MPRSLDLPTTHSTHAPLAGRVVVRSSNVVLLPGLLLLCTQRCGILG